MCKITEMLRSMFGGGEYTPTAPQQPSAPGNVIPTVIHNVANTKIGFVAFMTMIENDAVNKGFERGIVTAHAGHETGWGRSVINKNLFNRKRGSTWTGNVMRVKTWEYTPSNKVYDYFRSYDTYFKSYENYLALIRDWSNYNMAWTNRDDPAEYFYWLMHSPLKYATDPTYITKCLSAYNAIKNMV